MLSQLHANPSEFCILTVDLSATSDMKACAQEFRELVCSDPFKGLFADCKPRLTVGELRGHVLMLSRHEFGEKPIGGYCYGWVYDLELEKQTKGHIKCPDGSETPLWVQDYYTLNPQHPFSWYRRGFFYVICLFCGPKTKNKRKAILSCYVSRFQSYQ